MSQITQLLSEIEELARPLSLHKRLDMARRAANESRNSITAITAGLKDVERVTELEMENAAYQYACQYNLSDKSREEVMRRYDEALRAVKLGVNPYWMILRGEDFATEVTRLTKLTNKTKRNRAKLTSGEILDRIADVEGYRNKVDRLLQVLNKQLELTDAEQV
jgi:hypothetical protein